MRITPHRKQNKHRYKEGREMDVPKILVINFGSTSTKLAYVEGTEFKIRESISHDPGLIRQFKSFDEQHDMRIEAIEGFLDEHGISLDELDAIAPRGGQTEPIPGGTWEVNEAMLVQTKSGAYGHHVCNLGPWIGYDLAKQSDHARVLTTDTPTTNEMSVYAKYSGLPEIERHTVVQMLNIKAIARHWAKLNGKPWDQTRLVVVMLGGGISTVAIHNGRAIDAPDALEGEGAFSNNRAGTLPAGQLIKLCYSSGKTCEEMIRHINGEAGLTAYLGTQDMRQIMADIEAGDEHAKEVVEAMCYQTAKEIGAASTIFEGDLDSIILTGGMANIDFVVNEIKRRCGWIAPIAIMPGEREMEALAEGAYEGLMGIREIQQFVPSA